MGIGKTIKIQKIKASGIWEEKQDIIPGELLLNIFINGKRVSMLSCSPFRIIELVTGYIVSNGYTDDYGDIELIDLCRDEEDRGQDENDKGSGFHGIMSAKVRITGYNRAAPPEGLVLYLSAGCGNLDPAAIGEVFKKNTDLKKSKKDITVDYRVILELGKKLIGKQKYKKESGGLHSAALFDTRGQMLSLMEDLGRHNCIDKIFGHMLINSITPKDKMIFTSGRASLDLVFKALKMSVPIIVTNSSVTYNATEIAQKAGLTLIGYARGKRFNIYSCPERIIKAS
ncbi:MAG: formate dehydrogenase accessory sulfurtransferase FdhD [Actinobacteria bacterium]|nr:formate dehydrogenase accessory sulfurtransferase FdhD [Actinomycetota bacterium]